MLRAFRICKNIASISSWTWVMPNLVKAWKSAGILPLCITGYEIFTFSCLSIFFGPRGISGYPRHGPQSTRWFTRRLSLWKVFLAFAGLDSIQQACFLPTPNDDPRWANFWKTEFSKLRNWVFQFSELSFEDSGYLIPMFKFLNWFLDFYH